MQDILVVVDMQNDFIDGALGTKEAQAIVPRVEEKIRNFKGRVLFTRDSHGENYMDTQEGKKLPVPHCIVGSHGWQLSPRLQGLCSEAPIDKPSFGSTRLAELLQQADRQEPLGSVCLVGLCTDICVISNALLLKAFFPELPIKVDAECCAGVSPQSHEQALRAMKVCQIEIENE